MCDISASASAFLDLLVLRDEDDGVGSGGGGADDEDDDDASRRASRMASNPSNFPTCSSSRRSLNDDMTMFSRLRYCSRFARRLRCPRLKGATPSTTPSSSRGRGGTSSVVA